MLLEEIETLLVLSEEQTMSRVGSRLYISQSAVSKRIAKLEKHLGKKLIHPDGRNIKLTPEAHHLIANVGPRFNEIRGLISDQQVIQDETIIIIDCSETLVAGYLGELMGRYYQQDKYVSITTHHTPVILENVQGGRASIGFCAGHLPPQHNLRINHLFDEPFFVVSKHSLTSYPPGLLTIDLQNPVNMVQANVLQQNGITPLMQMDSYSAAAKLALGGVAPALIPISVIKTLNIPKSHCFHFPFLDELRRPVHLCFRPSSYASPRVRNLIDQIAQTVRPIASMP